MDNGKVIAALAQLDPDNPDHWVLRGGPKLEVIEGMIGEAITRKQLEAIMPEGFARDTAHEFKGDFPEPEPEEPDAIALIEKFCAAVQTDRFRGNSELQALARQWMVQQTNARTLQGRLDQRMTSRRARAADAADKAHSAVMTE